MKLQKVNHIGYSYFNKFKRNDATVFEVEITREDYYKIGNYNKENRINSDGIWFCAYECLKFDTLTGRLGGEQYAEVDGKYKVIKLTNCPELSVHNNEVNLDGTIDQNMIYRIEKYKQEAINSKIWP